MRAQPREEPALAIDVSEMVLVHRVFRGELGHAPALIDGVAAGDTARSRVVSHHLGHILAGLHHHHTADEEMLWPKLHERAIVNAKNVEEMAAQHVGIARIIERIESLRRAWAPSAQRRLTVELGAAARELAAA